MKINEDIEVKQNLRIIARDRGKIVDRRDTHNIFVDLGREWLTRLISYQSYNPDLPQRDDRVRYMGFGIGGTRQLAAAAANAPPIGGLTGSYAANSAAGIGGNSQTDLDRTVRTLERPVRLTGGSSHYPGVNGDIWLGRIQAPVEHPTAQQARFRRLFTRDEVSYMPFASVPLSEIGLFTSQADPGFYLNTLIAYDTFDTLSKTTAISIEVEWTFTF